MAKGRVAAKAGPDRQREAHPIGLLEVARQVPECVPSREDLDPGPFDRARARMTVDASKGRIRAILDPSPTVDTRQIRGHDAIKALANLEMERRAIGKMAGIAEIIVLFEAIAVRPARPECDDQDQKDQGETDARSSSPPKPR